MERNAVDVSAIIVSLNSKRFLRDCLDTLIHAPWRHIVYEIIVADNGSTDGTLEMLAESYPAARVLAIGKNIGFCPAGNLAAREVAGRYLLFLNDDILIQEDAIAKLVEWGFVNRGTHWRGRMLAFPVKCVFRLVSFEPLSILRALPISPWLVMLMRKEVAC